MAEQLYMIVRFKRNGTKPKVQRRNMTLADARLWCSREDTRDPKGKWFDGFQKQ